MGDVIRIAGSQMALRKPHPKACSFCVHVAFGQFGAYCTMYHEGIWDEEGAAAECGDYEE